MASLPEDRSETVFTDFKPAYDARQAMVEAERCLYCYDAPCITACPTSINIPEFIRKISTGNVKGSAKTIFDSNILGMSCSRVCPVEVLCVGDCVYNHLDSPPIQIGKLQRYATDAAYAEGWEFYEAGAPTGKKVACIGAGPASLAAAHRLRRDGHSVTIIDKREVLGGLNTTGVAPYKMKSDRAEIEADWVLGIGGIELRLGTAITDASWEAIEAEFDAIFLGFGLGPDSDMSDLPGAQLEGIEGAVAFIERFKLHRVDISGQKVVVVGGGNTAIDAVREVAGLGAQSVTMLYRGTEAKMSGYQHEWTAAKAENVQGAWQLQPVGFEGSRGKVTGIKVVRLDDQKKPIAGSEHVVAADLVLLAIGQAKLGSLVRGLAGVQTERGRIVTDEHGATGRAGVYAGGDCRNGGKEVVNAVAEGRDAALAIHAYLTGAN